MYNRYLGSVFGYLEADDTVSIWSSIFFPLMSTFWPHNYFPVTLSKGWKIHFPFFLPPTNNLTKYVGKEPTLDSCEQRNVNIWIIQRNRRSKIILTFRCALLIRVVLNFAIFKICTLLLDSLFSFPFQLLQSYYMTSVLNEWLIPLLNKYFFPKYEHESVFYKVFCSLVVMNLSMHQNHLDGLLKHIPGFSSSF